MADRPIIFSAPMIRALLDGRKTQTRRILKPQPDMTKIGQPCHPEPRGNGRWIWMACDDRPDYRYATADFRVRFEIGDRLWVRETWQVPALCDTQYRATSIEHIGHWDPMAGPWKSPIYMPRWASRITLAVIYVRVQRLQEIDEEDAKAEGVEPAVSGHGPDGPIKTYRTGFVGAWNEINGNWLDNPWVVALTFAVKRCNIDEVAG